MSYNKERVAKYLEANKDLIAAKKKARYEANKERYIANQRRWQAENKEKIRANQKRKMSENVLYRLKTNVKNLIGNSLRNNQFPKLSKTEQILGCTYEQFKEYLEAKFLPWMTWENRGLYNSTPNFGWDIDHIIPLASATCETDIIRLNHYSNLQPLCSHLNRNVKRATHETDVHN